jgi:TonB family protein
MVKPAYPPAAVPDKLQGQVIVRIVVSETGDVETAEVVSGNPVLANAAVDAAKQWKFKPYIRNGQPVKAAVKLPFDFAVPADAVPDAAPKPADTNSPPGKTEGSAASPNATKPLHVGSGVTQGLLIKRVDPIYPTIAAINRVQGVVLLGATISKEGTIKDLQVISGNPLLNGAAIDAVKQWRYRPYVMNGEPVEVDTQIIVNFTLQQR